MWLVGGPRVEYEAGAMWRKMWTGGCGEGDRMRNTAVGFARKKTVTKEIQN